MSRHYAAMKDVLWCLVALVLLTSSAVAAPKVIEESARFTLPTPPDERYFNCSSLVHDGNRMLCATRDFAGGPLELQRLHLYERESNGAWVLRTRLLETYSEPRWNSPLPIALEGNLAVIALADMTHVYEFTAGNWAYTPLPKPNSVGSTGWSVAISNGQIVVSGRSERYQAVVYRKDVNGNWQAATILNGGLTAPNSEGGPLVDISGSTVAMSGGEYDPQTGVSGDSIRIFTEANGAWTQTKVHDAGAWAMDLSGDSLAFFNYSSTYTLHLLRRNAGVWSLAARLQNPDLGASITSGRRLLVSGDLIAQEATDSDPGFLGSILIHQRSGNELKTVAELRASNELHMPLLLSGFSGRSVIASPDLLLYGRMVRFDIPLDLSQPGSIHDNFEDGNANGWTPANVNHWTIATANGSKVYRQTGLTEGAYTVFGNASWTNQSVQAEITPTSFSGSARWAGLIVRFKDFNNYYYVALRSSNRIELRKKVNGGFVTLATQPFTFTLGKTYRARLEAIGSQLRAYIDGVPMLEAIDRSLTVGRSGLQTSAARADFDNVRITANPLRYLFADTFSDDRMEEWTKAAGDWLDPPQMHEDPEYPDPQAHLRNFFQRSTSGTARAIAGIATDDMIVEAKARATSALTDGWFGVIGRYIDEGNFYYLRLGRDSVSIRRMVDGRWIELSRAPFATATNTTYTLRLEIVGDNLRGYVNGRHYVQATDASYPSGRYGLGTNFTAVRFDDVYVSRP